MSKGKVKEYDSSRGYGTIVDTDTGQELAVYANYVTLEKGSSLREGQGVEYEIENNRHQNWAINVRVL